MNFFEVLYAVSSLLFLRGALRMFESWALDGRRAFLVAGVVLAALAIDAGCD